MGDIFISYKREDKPLAALLADKLEACNWQVWWDHDLLGGEDYDVVIERELKAAKCVVVIWSSLSVQSRNVKDEARTALNRNVLVPVSFDHAQPPIGFGMTQVINFEDPESIGEAEFDKLCQSIRNKLQTGSTAIIENTEPPTPTKRPGKWDGILHMLSKLSLKKEGISYLKTFIVPVLFSFLLFPVKQIFEFKGIIVKEFSLQNDSTLCFDLYCTKDTIFNPGFNFLLFDTAHYSLSDDHIMYLASVPSNRLLNSEMRVYGPDNNFERAFSKQYIAKGKYKLIIPLINRTDGAKGIRQISNSDFSLKLETYDPPRATEYLKELREYHWYYWFFFHVWWCILGVFIISVSLAIIIKRKNQHK